MTRPSRCIGVFVAAILILTLSFSILARNVSAQSPSSSSSQTLPPLPPPPATSQEEFLPYWTTETGWDTEIQLRNNLPSATLTVTPVLRASNGTETPLQLVTVNSQDVKIVDVAAAIAGTAPQLVGVYGSVVLRYSAPTPGALFAMAMVRGIGHPFAFHIDPSSLLPSFTNGSREGVWWLPQETTTAYLVLTNQGSQAMQLSLSIYDANGKEFRQAVALGPGAMTRYSIRQLVAAGGLSGSYGGIKVSAPTQAGALDTLHVLFDETAGFSALLKMSDYNPATKLSEHDFAQTGQWTLRAPMLALSNPDPSLAFPSGTALHPQLFIRNTTAKAVSASLRFNWRSASATGKAAGPTLQLAPYQTQRVDVAALQTTGTISPQANWTSITLVTNGLPGGVTAVAASYDSALKYGAQTPFSDQLAYYWAGSLWEYDAVHDSIIAVGNGGTKPTQAAFVLSYNQGTKSYELDQTLQPDEQMWIDVGNLIRQHLPDKNGNVLPENVTTGSYEVHEVGQYGIGSLFEGKVVYDKTYGQVTYGCTTCCGLKEWRFYWNPLGIPDGGTSQQDVQGVNNCNGTWQDITGYFNGGSWSTANPAIAAVNSSGLHTGVSVGSTTTSTCSKNNMQVWEGSRSCPLLPVCPDAGQDSTNPSITSITPDIVPIATTNIQITIQGHGFGSSPTVSLPQGVSNLGQSANDTQITVTIAVSTSAPIGFFSISVTAGGLPSAPYAFTLDGAVEGVVITDNLFNCHNCTTAVARKVTMQVKNYSGTNASNIFIGESASQSGWTCAQPNPGVNTTNCGANYNTDSNGYMADQWSISSDVYSPVGCGFNFTTHWQWCAAGRTFLTLSGYTHTNAINMNGVVNPPNQFPAGQVIGP